MLEMAVVIFTVVVGTSNYRVVIMLMEGNHAGGG